MTYLYSSIFICLYFEVFGFYFVPVYSFKQPRQWRELEIMAFRVNLLPRAAPWLGEWADGRATACAGLRAEGSARGKWPCVRACVRVRIPPGPHWHAGRPHRARRGAPPATPRRLARSALLHSLRRISKVGTRHAFCECFFYLHAYFSKKKNHFSL
jgi:hypothetical protein